MFVLQSSDKVSRYTAYRLVCAYISHEDDSEILVWRTNKVSQEYIGRRTDKVPIYHIVTAEKNHTAFSAIECPKTSPCDAVEHRLVYVLIPKRQRAATEEIRHTIRWILHMSVDYHTILVNSIRLWIDVDSITEWAVHGSPHLTLQGIHISIGVVRVEDNDSAIVIVVNHF